jgi:hypothetical protein
LIEFGPQIRLGQRRLAAIQAPIRLRAPPRLLQICRASSPKLEHSSEPPREFLNGSPHRRLCGDRPAVVLGLALESLSGRLRILDASIVFIEPNEVLGNGICQCIHGVPNRFHAACAAHGGSTRLAVS